MHRIPLLEKLSIYHPACPDEIDFKERIVNFIQENNECFERSLAIGHVTASCWLLNKEHSHALMLHHAKLNKWFQLGGHCDGQSDTLAVALKEAQEESGIMGIEPISTDIFDIDIHLIPDNPKEKAHYHYDIRYLLHVVSNEQLVQNSESKELRWIGKNYSELPTGNPSVVRMFTKWLRL